MRRIAGASFVVLAALAGALTSQSVKIGRTHTVLDVALAAGLVLLVVAFAVRRRRRRRGPAREYTTYRYDPDDTRLWPPSRAGRKR
jgi:hypothetical protein